MYSPPERSTPCSVTTLPAEFTSWFPWTWIDSVDVAAATRTPNVCANEAPARAAMAMPARCFTTPRWVRGRRSAIRAPGLEVVDWLAISPRQGGPATPSPLRSDGGRSYRGLLPRRYRFL